VPTTIEAYTGGTLDHRGAPHQASLTIAITMPHTTKMMIRIWRYHQWRGIST